MSSVDWHLALDAHLPQSLNFCRLADGPSALSGHIATQLADSISNMEVMLLSLVWSMAGGRCRLMFCCCCSGGLTGHKYAALRRPELACARYVQGAWTLSTNPSWNAVRQWLRQGSQPLLLVLENVEALASDDAMVQVRVCARLRATCTHSCEYRRYQQQAGAAEVTI